MVCLRLVLDQGVCWGRVLGPDEVDQPHPEGKVEGYSRAYPVPATDGFLNSGYAEHQRSFLGAALKRITSPEGVVQWCRLMHLPPAEGAAKGRGTSARDEFGNPAVGGRRGAPRSPGAPGPGAASPGHYWWPTKSPQCPGAPRQAESSLSDVVRGGTLVLGRAETCRPVESSTTERRLDVNFPEGFRMLAALCLRKDCSTTPRACSVARERNMPLTFVAT